MQKPLRSQRFNQNDLNNTRKSPGIRSKSKAALSNKGRLKRGRGRRMRAKKRVSAVSGAKQRLRRFGQATMLTVAITALILMLFPQSESEGKITDQQQDTTVMLQDNIPDTVSVIRQVPVDDIITARIDSLDEEEEVVDTKAATDEAFGTLKKMWYGFYRNLPKIGLSIVIFFLAWLLVRLIKPGLRKILGNWERANAVIALTGIAIWMFAIGVVLSVLAGDIRALVGSLGLIGLALSWALQTPIESFTGWLLNSFQGYYRVGDRIAVGDVFGDVYKIDFLTTTVWEIGAPYRQGFVHAEQPTGRLVTFPNNEVLTGTIVNLTSDFPYVWDEMTVSIANESEMSYALAVVEKVSLQLLGNYMVKPAQKYEEILLKAGLESNIATKPQVFLSTAESWTDVVVRYLVGARERRKWKSELTLLLTQEMNKPEHKGRILSSYPRQQIQFVHKDGSAADYPPHSD